MESKVDIKKPEQVDFPENKQTSLHRNPREVSRAIVSVLTFLVTDSFNLSEPEQQWLGYQLGKTVKPLEALPAEVLLASVSKEMETGEFSSRLFNYQQNPEMPEEFYRNVRVALLEDWVTVISAAVLSSYPTAKPMIQTTIVGQIYGILSELGLTNNPDTSRRSIYLPNSIRHVLNNKK